MPKPTADDVIRALQKEPELLAEVRDKLLYGGQPGGRVTLWGLTMIEHEFGQRDEGWTLFISKDQALEYQKQHTEGCWSYEGPSPAEVTHEVAQLVIQHLTLHGAKGRSLPKGLIDISMVNVPKGQE